MAARHKISKAGKARRAPPDCGCRTGAAAGEQRPVARLPCDPGDEVRPGHAALRHHVGALLDRRRTDGGVLPARRAGSEARVVRRPPFHPGRAATTDNRGRCRNGRAGADLSDGHRVRSRAHQGLGDPVRDGHCLRHRHPRLAGDRARTHDQAPARDHRDRRRHRRRVDHCARLHRQSGRNGDRFRCRILASWAR